MRMSVVTISCKIEYSELTRITVGNTMCKRANEDSSS
jgi:hypothetical protein